MYNFKGLSILGSSVLGFLLLTSFTNTSGSEVVKTSVIDVSEEVEEEIDVEYESLPSLFSNTKIYERIADSVDGDESVRSGFDNGAVFKDSFAKTRDLAFDLSNIDEVSNFVIVEQFVGLKSDYLWLDYALRTPYGVMELNDDLGSNRLSSSFDDFALSELEKRALAANTFSPVLKYYFPEAKTRLLLVSEDISESSLEKLSEQLNEEEDVFVLAISDLATGIDTRTAEFQNAYTKNLIATLDYESVDEANLQSPAAVKVLLKFLQDKVISGDLMIDTERELHILAFGDMMLGRYVRTLMDRAGDKNYVFEKIEGTDGKFFSGVDIVHGNLEGPIKGQGKSGGTAMNFSFNEDIAPFLAEKGFDLMSLANNHAVDQGWDGRSTTIAALEKAGVDWCGHPSEADPNSVYYNSVGWGENELSYAFVCLHDVTFKLDVDSAVELIEDVNEKVDLVIVSIHWGYEYRHTADHNKQVEPAHRFVDAGADFVIGHHPHVVQNFEEYKGKYIFYSLGNFVFDQYWSQATQEELAIGIIIGRNGTEVYLIPMKSELSQSRLMTPEESGIWIEKFLDYGSYSEEVGEKIRAENLI